MLDVAVREPEDQDRRGRDSNSLHPRGRRHVLRLFHALHVGGQHAVASETRHTPPLALALDGVPDLGKGLSSEVVLESPSGKWMSSAFAGMSG